MSDEINSTQLEALLRNAIGNNGVKIEAVLLMCHSLGKELQSIPKEHRKLTVARLRNKVDNFREEGFTLGAMMFAAVADSWDDFSQHNTPR